MSAWGGISSLQFGLPLMWTEARKRGFVIQDLVRLMTVGPCQLARLDGFKGRICPGFDADFVLWDPLDVFTISLDNILYKNKMSPYLGKKVTCFIDFKNIILICLFFSCLE